jgi:transposase-like protein
VSDEPGRERAFLLYRVQGQTCAAVARELGTSAPSVIRWARAFEKQFPERARQLLEGVGAPGGSAFLARIGREHARQSAPPPAAAVAADDVDDEELDADDESFDVLSVIKRAIKANKRLAEQALAEGNQTVAARVGRDLTALIRDLRNAEKTMRTDENVMHVSRAEIDAAYASVLEKARVVCDKPLLCSECGRRLSVRLAGGEDE